MKKVFIFAAICLATCLLSCSSNSDEYISNVPSYNRDVANINMRTDEGMIEADASHQCMANVLFHRMEEFISIKSETVPFKKVFPDYYGGSYTDSKADIAMDSLNIERY